MAKFVSPCKNLRIVIKPARRQLVDGASYQIPGECIQFSNGQYETDNEKEIEFLRGLPDYGKEFYERITAAKEEANGFVCDECGQEFSSKAGLRAHMRVHNKEGE